MEKRNKGKEKRKKRKNARVTLKTWPKPETAYEKPKVNISLQFWIFAKEQLTHESHIDILVSMSSKEGNNFFKRGCFTAL